MTHFRKPSFRPFLRYAVTPLLVAPLSLAMVRSMTLSMVLALFSTASIAAPSAVSGLGYIEPENGIIYISGATSSGAVVSDLSVKEGDKISAGQVIAVLDSHDRLQAALRRAEAQLGIHKAKLNQLLAGPRDADVRAHEARIARLKTELSIADKECRRFKVLREKGTASEAALEKNCRDRRLIGPRVTEFEAQLESMKEIRPEDVSVFEAQVKDAEAAVSQAHVNYDLSFVRSPINGKVVQVYTQEGETISQKGIVGIAYTDQMWIIAEIYEADIANVEVGQTAKIAAPGVGSDLTGEVATISLLVGRNKILSLNPTATLDARVVEIGIRLDEGSSQLVENLTNLQVSVVIDTK